MVKGFRDFGRVVGSDPHIEASKRRDLRAGVAIRVWEGHSNPVKGQLSNAAGRGS